ncbi:MAG: DUF11 domain-containing protein, partial [Anaerolineales bacterium]|nr:DUF11 domain-containing protein [Anaerolineales bacterium]
MSILSAGLLVSLTLGQVNGVAGRGLGSEVPPPGQPGSVYLPLEEVGIPLSRHHDGRVDTPLASVFGSGICTAYGDPFTPDNPWVDQDYLYTYRYRIVIPADYELVAGTNRVRVEIMDPDSINQPTNTTFQIIHTDLFSHANPAIGQLGPPQVCTQNSQRYNVCQERTCEWDDQACTDVTGFPLDEINPYWLVRIDENRGVGADNGIGLCGSPSTYTERYNTAVRFDLVYPAVQDGLVSRRWLASYTGQTGDVLRDHDQFDHETDIRWVTPGGFNWLGPVPTDCGSPMGGYSLSDDDANMDGVDDPGTRCAGMPHRPVTDTPNETAGFELDLSSDLPNLYVDPDTGQRVLYLDVTALSGASENNYMLWAGPPDYELPANANLRNVVLLNDGGRETGGVRIESVNVLNMNAMFTTDITMPLTFLDERYAGLTTTISLFDPDAGTMPPVAFYFDTIPRHEFEVNFDSQGCWGTTGCNNLWVGAPGTPGQEFAIRVPNDFVSGTLMVTYQQGNQDTFTFVVQSPPLPVTPTQLSLTPAITGPVLVQPGERFSLTFQVNNAGPALAGGLTLSETVPAGLEFVSASAGGIFLFEPALGSPLWQLSDLASGGQGLITLSWRLPLTATPGTVLTHTLGLQGGNDA